MNIDKKIIDFLFALCLMIDIISVLWLLHYMNLSEIADGLSRKCPHYFPHTHRVTIPTNIHEGKMDVKRAYYSAI
jgi:hypothetical protein